MIDTRFIIETRNDEWTTRTSQNVKQRVASLWIRLGQELLYRCSYPVSLHFYRE